VCSSDLQAAVSQAHAPEDFRRRNVKRLFRRRARAEMVEAAHRQAGAGQRSRQHYGSGQNCPFPLSHFRFLYSNTRIAPHTAAAAYNSEYTVLYKIRDAAMGCPCATEEMTFSEAKFGTT
jgi:hypothetical protein